MYKKLFLIVFTTFFSAMAGFSQQLMFKHYTTEDGLLRNIGHCIHQDSKGYLWIGTEHGVSRFDGTVFKNYGKQNGLLGSKVVRIAEDTTQKIWIKFGIGKYQAIQDGKVSNSTITLNKIKFLFDERPPLDTSLLREYSKTLKKISSIKIRHIGITNSKKIFLIDDNRSTIYMVDPQSQKINNLQDILKLESAPTFLLVDTESNVWVTTDGGGLYCIYDAPFVNFTASSGLMNSFVHDIMEGARGRMLAGTKNGLYIFDNVRWRKVYFPVHVDYDKLQVWNFAKNRYHRLYMNTSIGMIRYGRQPQICLPDVSTQLPFIIGDLGEITILKKNFFHIYQECEGTPKRWPIVNKKIDIGYCLYEDSHKDRWIGTNQGVFVYKNGALPLHYTKEDGLPHNKINDIVEDSLGNIWLATELGLSKLKPDGVFENFDEKNGLLSNICRKIAVDSRGGVWVASPQGLHYYDEQNMLPYNAQTGLVSEDINCLYIDSQKRLWIGTSKGISMLNIEQLPKQDAPPKVHMEEVLIESNKQSNAPVDLLAIPYDSRLRFNYAAIAFIDSRKLTYQYEVFKASEEQRKSEWQTTQSRSLPLDDLRDGSYIFQLRAKKINSDWSLPIVVPFRISPPWWRTSWAIGVYVLIFGGLMWLTSYVIKRREERKTKLNKQFAELELSALQAQMNPHFIFNSLNAIQHFILNNDATAANSYLTKFARLMRLFLESSKSKYISVSDETHLLKLYIELEQLCYSDKFDYTFEVDENLDGDDYDVPTMIIQPYVENAIYHGLLNRTTKGHLWVNFYLKHNQIVCTIKDNGVGREKARQFKKQKHQSTGMSLTKNRLTVLNYIENSNIHVKVNDLKNGKEALGTEVKVWFPID